MKIGLIISMLNLVIGCSSPDNSINKEDCGKIKVISVMSGKDTLNVLDSSKKELSDKTVTITFSYAAIACGCPQWFETKYKNVKFLEGVDWFYLEPTDTSLLSANILWDGEHFPLTLKVTGTFSKEKILPPNLGIKDEPEEARVFWYEKITVVSPSSHKGNNK